MDPILSSFDRQFSLIDRRSRELLSTIDDDLLFQRPGGLSNSTEPFSCGECLVRSAAMVERAFGGITTRLWDDPFEWTLPEKLSNKAAILGYLDEVDATRLRGFAYFSSDADLEKSIPAPQKLTPLIDVLHDTLTHASHYQGRAFVILAMLTGKRGPAI